LTLARALELAERGRATTRPNPVVGAVVVGDGDVVGEGWHERRGGPHAEVVALEAAGDRARGATLYVTMEPCTHHGDTPPCTTAVLEAGVARVVAGSLDPNPKAGGGLEELRRAGVEVELVDSFEARAQNEAWRTWISLGRPFVTYKAAMTLDGRVAAPGGDSRWISAVESRELVHAWRSQCDAVAVGIGTALVDDPLLTARGAASEGGEETPPDSQPARVVFDSAARLPLDSALVQSVEEAPLYVICAPEAPTTGRNALARAGVEVVVAPGHDRAARLRSALDELGRREIQDLLFEGGPTLAGALFDAGEIDELRLFVAPVLLGAGDARAVIEGEGARRIADGLRPLAIGHEAVGEDLLITARLREW
jgi:diaminohydroxyphosphoribosylaminopyrimidine deaminase/5-amino-6-(5-phosphoribosylamino)uracil reductase